MEENIKVYVVYTANKYWPSGGFGEDTVGDPYTEVDIITVRRTENAAKRKVALLKRKHENAFYRESKLI